MENIVMSYKAILIIVYLVTVVSCIDLSGKERVKSKLDDNTLLGPDKNNDGVRDDIEYWIKTNINEDIDYQRAVLLYAKAWRDTFKVIDDRWKTVEMTHKKSSSRDCMTSIIKKGVRYIDKNQYFGYDKRYKRTIEEKIIELISNSEIRVKAYAMESVHFRGQGMELTSDGVPSIDCPFKLVEEYRK
jgi:hypothetical protein